MIAAQLQECRTEILNVAASYGAYNVNLIDPEGSTNAPDRDIVILVRLKNRSKQVLSDLEGALNDIVHRPVCVLDDEDLTGFTADLMRGMSEPL